METVKRWWNGTWGRMARRDVYLRVGAVWEVEARQGGAEGTSSTWRFDTEDEALTFALRCLTGPGKWRELTAFDKSHPDGARSDDSSTRPEV